MNNWLTPFKSNVEKLYSGEDDFIDRAILLWNILHYVIKDYQEMQLNWLFIKHEEIAYDLQVSLNLFLIILRKILQKQ